MIRNLFTISAILLLCSFATFRNNIESANCPNQQSPSISEETIKWLTIEEAVLAQEKNPKPIMIDVYTKWCGPCKMMSQNTFTDPRVAKYLDENFYCVKFDAESPEPVNFGNKQYNNPEYDPTKTGRNGVHEFSRFLNVGSYPTLFFMDKKAQGLGPVVGYRTPAQLEIFLHYFSEEKYTTVRTQEEWQAYEKDFVVTWN